MSAASTWSTSTPPPSAASGSPTCPRPPPRRSPSTRWRWRWRSSRQLPFRTATSAAGTGAWTRRAAARPATLTLGLLGLGRIGRRTAELADGVFGAVAAHDPGVPANAWPRGVQRLELGALADRADVLSLHLPPTSRRAAARRRRDARRTAARRVPVNVSRGGAGGPRRAARRPGLRPPGGRGARRARCEPPPARHALVHHPARADHPTRGVPLRRDGGRLPREQAANVLAWQRTGRPLTPVRELT